MSDYLPYDKFKFEFKMIYISFKTQKRSLAKSQLEKNFYELLSKAFYGKTKENVRNRIKVEFIERDDSKKFIEQQSNITSNGIHKYCTNYASYTFRQNEVLMDKPFYLRFVTLELSKLLMYEI